jgi:hypothetical protein
MGDITFSFSRRGTVRTADSLSGRDSRSRTASAVTGAQAPHDPDDLALEVAEIFKTFLGLGIFRSRLGHFFRHVAAANRR